LTLEYIGILIFLALNIWALFIAYQNYKDKKILTGTKYVFLSIACFIVFYFLCLEINFEFPWELEIFIAAYAFTKVFYLAVLYYVNIKRVENKEKYFSSVKVKVVIFFSAIGVYLVTQTIFEPKFYVFAEALYIPLLGATIIQWLEINVETAKNAIKKFLE
jgi:hypothetical protein